MNLARAAVLQEPHGVTSQKTPFSTEMVLQHVVIILHLNLKEPHGVIFQKTALLNSEPFVFLEPRISVTHKDAGFAMETGLLALRTSTTNQSLEITSLAACN
jgi:hypothetical protein